VALFCYVEFMIDQSCRFSFDDLHIARFGRAMTEQEKTNLYDLTQEDRNVLVGEWAFEANWKSEVRVGDDGKKYRAFWKGGE